MKSRIEQYAELFDIMDRLPDGEVSQTELDRLQELIEGDPDALRAYVDYCHFQCGLPWELGPSPPSGKGGRQEVAGIPRSPVLGFLGDALQQWTTMLTNPLQGGSMLVLVLLAFFVGRTASSRPTEVRERAKASGTVVAESRVSSPAAEAIAPVVVGRYVRGMDAVWGSKPALVPGDHLESGQMLHLDKGSAEIAFNCGARVFLDAPARFELVSALAGVLHEGSLSTDVPEEARGFLIETPKASIIDQGTSFSVKVDRRGNAEAFVHDGEIHVGVNDNGKGPPEIKKLFKGEGVRIDVGPRGRATVHALESPLDRASQAALEKVNPTEPLHIAGLRLWLKADSGVSTDVDGKHEARPGDYVARWVDQSGNGLSPMQLDERFRPCLIVDEQGRRAIRFSGDFQRLEEPSRLPPMNQVLDPSDRAKTRFTMCMVFRQAERASSERYAFVLFGQFPLTASDSSSGHTSRLFGLDPAGRLLYDEWPPKQTFLRTPDSTIDLNRTYVMVVTRNGNDRAIHIDGKLAVADQDAECYAGNDPNMWWIGGRAMLLPARYENWYRSTFFKGDIFEFIVFTRAVSDGERECVEYYLANKYQGKMRADAAPAAAPRPQDTSDHATPVAVPDANRNSG